MSSYSDMRCSRAIADGGEVPACPECDRASPRRLVHSAFSSHGDSDKDWYCNHCGARFDVPEYRQRKFDPGLKGLARKLDEADADDVGEPMTDGGTDQWHSCICGAEYRSRRAALRCCGDRL